MTVDIADELRRRYVEFGEVPDSILDAWRPTCVERIAVGTVSAAPFDKTILVGCNARRRIDHRLLADAGETGGWPIEILDQQDHRCDDRSHQIDRKPQPPRLQPVRITNEDESDDGDAVQGQKHDVGHSAVHRLEALPLLIDHLVERLNEHAGRHQARTLLQRPGAVDPRGMALLGLSIGNSSKSQFRSHISQSERQRLGMKSLFFSFVRRQANEIGQHIADA